ncbi:ribonuclease HII [Virgibacillus soli]|uniref:Ribonuclease HII n=1 Tax=Paracerasibacillus soli TaxID=480284 RepID=A0ABU5CQK4_9BACI|nr:ribonuclease HII [Virgibacillus soli]MDY0408146.1 ribonuclease HII [Virgibacillus soli]
MQDKTIAEIKQLIKEEMITDSTLKLLKNDKRKGVQQLLKVYEKKQLQHQQLITQFQQMSVYEKRYQQLGYQHIAGIDEAGRGPLAGPVVAAAVILPPSFELLGLNDSKQLNEQTRLRFFHIIKEHAISYGVGIVDNEQIDRINIYEATKNAMLLAMEQLSPTPDFVLIDAVPLHNSKYPFMAMDKGDQKSVSIAAASILAKVTRDQLMKQLHEQYPVYQFDRNMGYGTKGHMDALSEYGPTDFHRKSFAPVKNCISNKNSHV